jgi:type I restriction enzyme S subunit
MWYNLNEMGTMKNVQLKDLVKINQGLQIPIEDRFLKPLPDTLFYITNEFLKSSGKNYYIRNSNVSVQCSTNDILMTRTGNTGQVVTGVNGVFHNNFFKVNYDERLDKDFLVQFLRSEKTQKLIIRYAGTSTIPDLNHKDFYRLSIPLYDIQQQKKIGNLLSTMDKIRVVE